MINKIQRFSGVKSISLLILFILLGAIIIWVLFNYTSFDYIKEKSAWFSLLTLSIFVLSSILAVPIFKRWTQGKAHEQYRPEKKSTAKENKIERFSVINDINENLQANYGHFWRKKVSILLITGSSSAVEKSIPQLTSQFWLEAHGVLLIWAGEVSSEIDSQTVQTLKQLRRRRPLDGIVWVTDGVSDELSPGVFNAPLNGFAAATLDSLNRQFHSLYRALGWTAPVYLWSVQSGKILSADDAPAVSYLFEPKASETELAQSFSALLPSLIERGTQALLRNTQHLFLLSLASFMRHGGQKQLVGALSPLMSGHRPLPLAGMVFSTPTPSVSNSTRLSHVWTRDARWGDLLDSLHQLPAGLKPKALGWNGQKLSQQLLAAGLVIWGGGLLVSYFANRQLIDESRTQAALAADKQQPVIDRLNAQYTLQQTLGRLQHRADTSTPLYLRFGLNINPQLLETLWPIYGKTLLPLLRDTTRAQLEQPLDALAQLAPNTPERAAAARPAYDILKAYLMLSQPQHMAPKEFATAVLANWQQQPGVSEAQWATLGSELLTFFAQQLPHHPEWAIKPNNALIGQTRTILIREMGQRNGESAMYQKILQQAAHNFADMSLNDMVGDTDVSALFTTDEFVSGIFTRKAWEESIEPAIRKTVNDRREEIDWVLSDNSNAIDADISPEVLQERLTARYFNDFSGSWLNFLNSLQWRHTDSLSDTIDQLTLMSDTRQSPVIALMNTLAYQGKTGRTQDKLADSFVSSAKEMFNKEQQPVISQKADFKGPLELTFGPLLELIESNTSAGQSGDNLSLTTYLTRVTRVRLKLQQVVNAPDPQAMSQALAQSIFEGKSVDLADTRDYGSLVAASLGQEWHGLGDTLLVQPLEQAWQQLLMPTAQSLNVQWQNAIVNDWNTAFGGRYPFKNTQSDVSLPLLTQYLQADSGRIQRFLDTRLKGVLRKEGNRWVPDSTNAQGLNFNPEFLTALETLGHLSDVVFAEGEARVYFELRPGTSKDIMQTTLTIDKQALKYNNQLADWRRVVWPADTVAAGASLSWLSTQTGTRILGDYPGTWGFIRLLGTAKITPYAGNTSSFRVTWLTPQGQALNYILRTEMGDGPMALLKLRGFVLPTQIFLDK
nr:ImcF-related family protein [uncultured Moellerella sp.]